jgi:HEAT repeat protein
VALEFGGDRTYATTVRQMIVNAEPAQHPAMQAKLLDALTNPKITDAGRQFVCRMLGLVGTAESIPALAELLNDDGTADVARSALDFMADPAVDDAYRAALSKLTGAAKIGLIGSVAKRPGDTRTIDALKRVASDIKESAGVRIGAKRALEMLGVEVRS